MGPSPVSRDLVVVPAEQPVIHSEVSFLASPERSPREPPQRPEAALQPHSPPWRHPPPPALPLFPLPGLGGGGGGGAAALFDTASEAVSTLEYQYRATVRQLEVMQGMYTRLSEHNAELSGEFDRLRGQLERLHGSVSFGMYNEVRRVKAELKTLRKYVEFVLCDYRQHLEATGRAVLQGVRDAVSDATGEGALLPYYAPDAARVRATAASVAAANTGQGSWPESPYRPDGWFGVISSEGSRRAKRSPAAAASSGSVEEGSSGGCHSSSWQEEERKAALAEVSSAPGEPTAEAHGPPGSAEDKGRLCEADYEKRVQRVRDAYMEKQKTMQAEILLLRRALGMPTEDTPLSPALEAREVSVTEGGADEAGRAPQRMAEPPPPLPPRHDDSNRPLVDARPPSTSSPTSGANAKREAHGSRGSSGDDSLAKHTNSVDDDRENGDEELEEQASYTESDPPASAQQWRDPDYGAEDDGDRPMRERGAPPPPFRFDAASCRAVERRVRAMVAHGHGGRTGWGRGGGDRDDANRGEGRQRWQRSGELSVGTRRSGGRSQWQEAQLEGAAQRLLEMVDQRKRKAVNGGGGNATAVVPFDVVRAGEGREEDGRSHSLGSPPRSTAVVGGLGRPSGGGGVSIGPGARRLPDQEANDIQREAEGCVVPSGQLTRPLAPSDVSKVARGLWAEQLLAQRGM